MDTDLVEIKEKLIRSEKSFSYNYIKYLLFLVPFFSKKLVNKQTKKQLKKKQKKSNTNVIIYIICLADFGASDSRTFNDTHREKLFYSIQLFFIQYKNGWLDASDLSDVFTQSIKFYYTLYYTY